ncbi:hypothetical protein ACGFZB_25265 [Streptomyces cinerochromogenes]|uniref:Uncharacterized protein n=1 Tax=Streptomyces cinerochromogenes TaxID=66422 RepID=A0ABW7B927_9ACTN
MASEPGAATTATELLSVRDGRPSPVAGNLLRRHLGRLEAEMARLRELQREMATLLRHHTEGSPSPLTGAGRAGNRAGHPEYGTHT